MGTRKGNGNRDSRHETGPAAGIAGVKLGTGSQFVRREKARNATWPADKYVYDTPTTAGRTGETMQPSLDWTPRCAFVCDYFFGAHKKVAQQVAEYLARYYVGEDISELRPDTDVSALIGDSIRRYIDKDDFTLDRDDNLLAEVDLMESITFKDLVDLVHSQRGMPA